MDAAKRLQQLHAAQSKHSNYQIMPGRLQKLLGDEKLEVKSRFEEERLKFILKNIDVAGKSLLDIGANTGYFSFELLEAGAANVHYYEGNKEHAEFVKLAAEALGLEEKLQITNGYYSFDDDNRRGHYDVGLLFNVLHHVGDDYGDKNLSISNAKNLILKQLNSMSAYTDELVFQLGFNWHGNVSKPLFAHGTKSEMIEYVKKGIKGSWQIVSIGIAQKKNGTVDYTELNEKNIERDDSLGEFLNRPIFILKSKKAAKPA